MATTVASCARITGDAFRLAPPPSRSRWRALSSSSTVRIGGTATRLPGLRSTTAATFARQGLVAIRLAISTWHSARRRHGDSNTNHFHCGGDMMPRPINGRETIRNNCELRREMRSGGGGGLDQQTRDALSTLLFPTSFLSPAAPLSSSSSLSSSLSLGFARGLPGVMVRPKKRWQARRRNMIMTSEHVKHSGGGGGCSSSSSSSSSKGSGESKAAPGSSRKEEGGDASSRRRSSSSSSSSRGKVQLVNGKPQGGPDLSVEVNGLKFPNPFVIASGPPGTNYTVMKKAFDEGWGGVICKTLSLDSTKVVNVTPRYARMKAEGSREVIGWENIELISDRPFEVMLSELKRLKEEYPDRILIASIMEEADRGAWEEIVERVQGTGVDGIEINFSCPHGLPERRMGMAMGQDCKALEEVCKWVNAKATVPVWAKVTPNVTDITKPSRAALLAGCEGISAINTITSVMGINLQTLRPEPCVEGYSTPGGYSSKAIRPIALAKVMAIANMVDQEFGREGRSVSGIGGVETGGHAAEFILLGAHTVQVCTGVMVHGYSLVHSLCEDLQSFMRSHGFERVSQFRGHSLQYFTSHSDLVQRQKNALAKRRERRIGLANDDDWTGDGFVKESETMVSNT
ncbi:hypothetical protein CBR_g39071 [Chara braunii]|uniref:dihydropyrimidine dehydrogenase (NADP(+)) n=1 Tax=Chara braunii TaxID=69332 RepID=A0A388LR11_CHABU|nr:hypothetical protein CBR_g39071 [Chara braunii]|eukprot:GBG84695.1 hypothetical protein CBR_g39071 [Chara braunii]